SPLSNSCLVAVAVVVGAGRGELSPAVGTAALRFQQSALDAVAPLLESDDAPSFEQARYLVIRAFLAMARGDREGTRALVARIDRGALQRGPVDPLDTAPAVLDGIQEWLHA